MLCILCMELFTHTFASVFICYYIMIMWMYFVFICFNGVTVPKAIKWNWLNWIVAHLGVAFLCTGTFCFRLPDDEALLDPAPVPRIVPQPHGDPPLAASWLINMKNMPHCPTALRGPPSGRFLANQHNQDRDAATQPHETSTWTLNHAAVSCFIMLLIHLIPGIKVG